MQHQQLLRRRRRSVEGKPLQIELLLARQIFYNLSFPSRSATIALQREDDATGEDGEGRVRRREQMIGMVEVVCKGGGLALD